MARLAVRLKPFCKPHLQATPNFSQSYRMARHAVHVPDLLLGVGFRFHSWMLGFSLPDAPNQQESWVIAIGRLCLCPSTSDNLSWGLGFAKWIRAISQPGPSVRRLKLTGRAPGGPGTNVNASRASGSRCVRVFIHL